MAENEITDHQNVAIEFRVARRLDFIELFIGNLGVTRDVGHVERRCQRASKTDHHQARYLSRQAADYTGVDETLIAQLGSDCVDDIVEDRVRMRLTGRRPPVLGRLTYRRFQPRVSRNDGSTGSAIAA